MKMLAYCIFLVPNFIFFYFYFFPPRNQVIAGNLNLGLGHYGITVMAFFNFLI